LITDNVDNRVSTYMDSRSPPYIGVKVWVYRFKTHFYFIARYTDNSQMAAPMLSSVTWALLRLLVYLLDWKNI